MGAGALDLFVFHTEPGTPEYCGSGMMKTADQFCWYQFYHHKDVVKKYLGKEDATAREFAEWLGGKGTSFSCNMYTMFSECIANLMDV